MGKEDIKIEDLGEIERLNFMREAATNVGKTMGRIEGFMESAHEVTNAIPEITNLIRNPDDKLKICNALIELSSKILAKT